MSRKGHTEEQILQALRQAEGGEKAAEICRKLGISEQTFLRHLEAKSIPG
jgi:putative transposase